MKTYFILFFALLLCIISCKSKDEKQYKRNIKYNLEENILSISVVEKKFDFLMKDDGKIKEVEFSGNDFKFTILQPYSENMNYISQTLQLTSPTYTKSYSLIKSNIKNKSTLSLSYFLSFQICKATAVLSIKEEYILLEKIARSIINKENIQDVAGCYLLAGDSISTKITRDVFKISPFSFDDDKIFHEMKIDSLLAIYPNILVIDTSRLYEANKDFLQESKTFFKWRDSIGTLNIEIE